jgi:hypothetical protein
VKVINAIASLCIMAVLEREFPIKLVALAACARRDRRFVRIELNNDVPLGIVEETGNLGQRFVDDDVTGVDNEHASLSKYPWERWSVTTSRGEKAHSDAYQCNKACNYGEFHDPIHITTKPPRCHV